MNKAAVALGMLGIGLAVAAVALGLRAVSLSAGAQTLGGAWTIEQQRELAGKLKGAGLLPQAIREYEAYVRTAAVDSRQLANLCYTIGSMSMDAGNYEDALAWLYRVEIADPGTPLKTEVGSKIINCLERTGKYSAAEYALSKRAAGQTESAAGDRTVVAEIGNDKIYREDVNAALDSLPAWMRAQFEGNDKKINFLRKYVADELLYRKAVKLEYDKDPEVRRKLENLKREMLVNRVLEQELKDKITVAPDDLKNFYEAHRQNYVQKEAARVRLIKAGLPEVAEKIVAQLRTGKDFAGLAREFSLDNQTALNGGLVDGWIRKGEDDLGIGNADGISRVLFAATKGEITPPVEAGGYHYIFRIEDTRPEKIPAFEQIAEQVQNDYRMQKLNASYQQLLEQILKTSDVKLHPEKLAGEGSS
jgi:parvulin-like peptidyl-prolyl isomerase